MIYQTARSDLLALANRQLLEMRKAGKRFVFVPPADLRERLERLGRGPRAAKK